MADVNVNKFAKGALDLEKELREAFTTVNQNITNVENTLVTITDFDGSYESLTGKPNVPANLSDLENVANAVPAEGEVLKWNGNSWAPAPDKVGSGGTGSVEGVAPMDFSVGADDSTLHPINSGESILFLGGGNITTSSDAEGNITITYQQPVDVSEFANDAGYITASDLPATRNWATITNTPNTIAGYGIVDAFDGAYNSLTGRPTLPVALSDLSNDLNISDFPNNIGYITGLSFAQVTGKPNTLGGYGITDAATSAQGALANSAVQPGDNISTLTNNVGYLTDYQTLDLTGSTLSISNANSVTINFSNIGSKPTTLAGYGITDAATDNQGALANSAVQPGDAVTTLFNDAGYISGIGSLSIDALSDVDTTSTPPTAGQVLKWNGTNWAPGIDATTGGAGTDADTLDGFDSSYFLNYNNLSNKPDLTTLGMSIQIAADDSTQQIINNGEVFQILGGTGISTASDPEGAITITANVDYGDVANTPTLAAVATSGSAGDLTDGPLYFIPNGDGSTSLTMISNSGNIRLESATTYINGFKIPASVNFGGTDPTVGQVLRVKSLGPGGVYRGDLEYATLSYNDLADLPEVNNYTFNIAADDSTQRTVNSDETIKIIGGGSISTSSDVEGNITVSYTQPSNVSTFTNDAGYLTSISLNDFEAGVLISTADEPLYNDTEIMTSGAIQTNFAKNSDPISTFTNDAGYITSSALSGYATQSFVTSQGYITSSALSSYATQSFVTSQGYATQSFVTSQGYLTTGGVDGHLNTSTATTGQVLSWTGLDYDWVAQSPGGGDVVSDTTPQLGGNLDLNSNDITGIGNVDITGDITISGTVTANLFTTTGTGSSTIEAATNLNLDAGNAVVISNSVLRLKQYTTAELGAVAAQNGDIAFDTTNSQLTVYNSGWERLISNLADDISPSLSADLDVGEFNLNNTGSVGFKPGVGTNITVVEAASLCDNYTLRLPARSKADGRMRPLVNEGSDTLGYFINPVHYFDVTNNGTTAYTFTDEESVWFPSAEDNPVLYLRRGEVYVFDMNAAGHPFEIRVSNGGAAYTTGVTTVLGNETGEVTFMVPMSAPATLYYQCTVHSGMGAVINIV